ncbi:MAG: SGNH/GDSL hydrolase family protein [Betaproteobacteria bacterium]|nr:SGNH/GDSL hydrolase family protein [Betaproteobacteria bacterium]
MRSSQYVLPLGLAALLTAATCAWGAPPEAKPGVHWVASWGTAVYLPELQNLLPAEQWRDASLRQIVHVSLGGSRLRVRLSNAAGTTPLFIEAAGIAKAEAAGKPGIDGPSARALTFAGRASVMIPAGAEYYSDPVALEHGAASDLAVSLYFKGEPIRQTGHPGSRANSFLLKGNRVMDAAWPDAAKVEHWYQLADIEVEAPNSVGAVVAIGDSITDGHGATTDGNDRWPDFLAARLVREQAPGMGLVNTGIGGGRLLRDGLGPNLVARFDRDVLTRSGVTHAIVLIGVNDLGGQHRNGDDIPAARAKLVEDLQGAFRQIVARAHAQHVCVIGATLTPYSGSDYYRPNAANEADRQMLNAWIRGSGVFDAVADFDAAIRDPAKPERMRAEHDCGDGLHPSPAGFRAMSDAVPMSALRGCP